MTYHLLPIYYILLPAATVLAFFAENCRMGRRGHKEGELSRTDVILLLPLLMVLLAVSGFRYQNFYWQADEYVYRNYFMYWSQQKFDLELFFAQRIEIPWNILVWLLSRISKNSQLLIFTTSLFTQTSLILFFRKYAKKFWFVVYLYIATGSIFASWNIIRQYFALAIAVWSFQYLISRNFLRYCMVVVIASCFHVSALVLIPMYFVLTLDRFDARANILYCGTVIGYFFWDFWFEIMLGHTSYAYYNDGTTINGSYGQNPLGVLATLSPLLGISLFCKRYNDGSRKMTSLLYAVVLSICLSVLSLKNVYVTRIALWIVPLTYLMILQLPEILKGKQRYFILSIMMAVYFALGTYRAGTMPYLNVLIDSFDGPIDGSEFARTGEIVVMHSYYER